MASPTELQQGANCHLSAKKREKSTFCTQHTYRNGLDARDRPNLTRPKELREGGGEGWGRVRLERGLELGWELGGAGDEVGVGWVECTWEGGVGWEGGAGWGGREGWSGLGWVGRGEVRWGGVERGLGGVEFG